MVCPKCGIEMKRISLDKWICRNPRCTEKKKEDKENGDDN